MDPGRLTKGPVFLTIFLALGCFCISCGVQRHLPSEVVNVRDSVALHIRDSVAIRFDTVSVELPVESRSVLLASSDSSHLETALATSDAWTDSLGLHHTLENKGGALKKAVAIEDHYRSESSVTQLQETRTVTVVEEVERELTWWQRFWIGSGKVLWSLVAGAAVYVLLKFLIKKIL